VVPREGEKVLLVVCGANRELTAPR